ncbi:helix-turn-helix domain-containing protein [Glaciecola sp. 1036]|uniref:helix-turn-helix domain-containing protein n=1 Tax=Alteromonadaceae TaxID=72275 RepID=UPI003D035CD9
MISESLLKVRKNPQTMVENKISFATSSAELSVYDTFEKADRVKLKADQLLYCGMIAGKKIMHLDQDNYHREFLPHESFILAPGQLVEIDFPDAQNIRPTTCLAIEIPKEKIKQVCDYLNHSAPLPEELGEWHYNDHMVHTSHNQETQALLSRIVNIFTEDHPDKSFLSDLAVSELTARLLRHQTREIMVNFSRENPEHNGITQAVSYLEANFNRPLDIDTLCKKACMSRTKFFQKFKQSLGCSPSHLQLQLRIQGAQNLLKQGYSVTYVAYEMGFLNVSHFSRCFKQVMGIAPSRYN